MPINGHYEQIQSNILLIMKIASYYPINKDSLYSIFVPLAANEVNARVRSSVHI